MNEKIGNDVLTALWIKASRLELHHLPVCINKDSRIRGKGVANWYKKKSTDESIKRQTNWECRDSSIFRKGEIGRVKEMHLIRN